MKALGSFVLLVTTYKTVPWTWMQQVPLKPQQPYTRFLLNLEAASSFRTLITTYKTNNVHNPENQKLDSHYHENLKSHK
jgi:hypothetical protein